MLIVLFTGLIIPQGLALAEESGEVVEEKVVEETVTEEGTEIEEETTPEEITPVETEFVSTNLLDLLTIKVTDRTETIVYFETDDLSKYALKETGEVFFSPTTLSLPFKITEEGPIRINIKINFDKCSLENIETFKTFFLSVQNFYVYKAGISDPVTITPTTLYERADVEGVNARAHGGTDGKTLLVYNRNKIEGVELAENNGDVIFWDKNTTFSAGTAGAITFDLVSYVEIEKRTGENPPIDVEEEINNFGEKISEWINENTGIALSGTMSLIVVVAVVIVVIRFLGGKRRR